MTLIKTESFELAVYAQGDIESPELALLLPGRLDSKDYAHMRSHVDYLADLGYYALAFDPPGTWESPGDMSDYSTANYLKAINELIERFDNRPTVAMGHSRGGSMAMLAALTNPNVTHMIAAMSHYGPSIPSEATLQNKKLTAWRDMPPGIKPTAEQMRFELPLAYFDDRNTYAGLDTCQVPKLFFYGESDSIVDPADVQRTYASAGNPKQLHALDSVHDYRYQPEIIDEVNLVTGVFLGKVAA